MKERKGPFKLIMFGNTDLPLSPNDIPDRNYSCANYDKCLNISAALDWEDYSCRGCCGEVNGAMLWQARLAIKKDRVAQKVCSKIHVSYEINDDFEEVA